MFIYIFLFLGGAILFIICSWLECRKILAIKLDFDVFISRMGGQKNGNFKGEILVGDKVVSINYTPPLSKELSQLMLQVKGEFSNLAVVTKESDFQRLGKNLNINKEPQIGDFKIDNEFYFYSNDESFIKEIFSVSETKTALKKILIDFNCLDINNTGCSLIKWPCKKLSDLNCDEILRIVDWLCLLTNFIPIDRNINPSKLEVINNFKDKEPVLIGITLLLIVLSVVSFFISVDTNNPLLEFPSFVTSLWVSIPLLTSFIIFITFYLKGYPESFNEIGKGTIIGTVFISLFGWGVIGSVNKLFDINLSKDYVVSILGFNEKTGKHSSGYNIQVDSKGLGVNKIEFSVSDSEFEIIKDRNHCKITIKLGLFGYRWLAEHDCRNY